MADKWKIQVKKVLLPYLILQQISNRPQYGYYIMKIVNEKNLLDIHDGTLYPILTRLTEEKLINYEWIIKKSSTPRKYYTISNKGIEALNLMKDTLHNFNELIFHNEIIDN